MRKVVLDMMVSLDGFIDGPNGELDWVPFDEEFQKYNNRDLSTFDTFLYGRVAYQKAGTMNMDEFTRLYGNGPDVVEFVNRVNDMTKVVFSMTLERVEGNGRIVRGDVVEEVKRMKQQPGKDMALVAGPGLVSMFIRHGLIDEYRIGVVPVVLGGGKPLFKAVADRRQMKLTEAKPFRSGVVMLNYQPDQEI
jgi:dihydrofolate reductase